ncbi:MAG: hypothetical protein ACYSUB_01725 [Planctomycetota bacterium]|jgi:hypothetical protein
MTGWRDNELRQNRFTGRDDDKCADYDRDWRHLLRNNILTDQDREELCRVLAQKFLSDTDRGQIKRALGEEE